MYTDQEFIVGILKNNQKVINSFITKYENYLYTISFTVLKNKEESEEATQDSFLKIIKSLPEFVPKCKLSTWMYTIAYRTSLDYLKKRKRTEELSDHEGQHVSSSEKLLIDKEKKQSILQLINRLPVDERGLIRLFYLEEQSIKEISSALNLTESNIKVKLYRARKALHNHARKSNYFSGYKVGS